MERVLASFDCSWLNAPRPISNLLLREPWSVPGFRRGANGQGETINEAKDNLRQAIELILEDRREDLFRGLPEDVIREKILIG